MLLLYDSYNFPSKYFFCVLLCFSVSTKNFKQIIILVFLILRWKQSFAIL